MRARWRVRVTGERPEAVLVDDKAALDSQPGMACADVCGNAHGRIHKHTHTHTHTITHLYGTAILL